MLMATSSIPNPPWFLPRSPSHLMDAAAAASKLRFFPPNIISRGCFFCTLNLRTEKGRARAKEIRARGAEAEELKENWVASLSCPFQGPELDLTSAGIKGKDKGKWVLGIDPDASGALALLKDDDDDASCCSVQDIYFMSDMDGLVRHVLYEWTGVPVNIDGYTCRANMDGNIDVLKVFDTPHLKVLVGKRVRKRLDARSIVQLLHSFGAPLGTTAYIEQSSPFPQDGKQGWWSGGFTYGLWIGILVSTGFSVVPVSSRLWKDHFQLYRNSSSKDDSRKAASDLFPSLSSSLKRKKDHGRAEALLIAAYGKGLRLQSKSITTTSSVASIPTLSMEDGSSEEQCQSNDQKPNNTEVLLL